MTMESGRALSVLFVGNLDDRLTGSSSVGLQIAHRLRQEGWRVQTTSAVRDRPLRLLDMLRIILLPPSSYDVAHVDVFSGLAFVWGLACSVLLRILRKPLVLTLRGGDLPGFSKKHPRWVTWLLGLASVVTVPSEYLGAAMRPFREDVYTIRNPVDIDGYHFRPRSMASPRLVWLRAFHEIYNPIMAVKTVEHLATEWPGISLTMYGRDKGDGSLQDTVAAADRGLARGKVTIAGPVAKHIVPTVLSDADIFLNTATIDNAPVSVLEAMACGLIVVSTEVGGVPYMIHNGVNGLLVQSGDAAAMANAVRKILCSPELGHSLSLHARRTAEVSSIDNLIPEWRKVFWAAVDGAGGHALDGNRIANGGAPATDDVSRFRASDSRSPDAEA
jgi:glycosyltransferase involved in cell wall biosynthesis